MPGANTFEYRAITKALRPSSIVLNDILPEATYEILFFQEFGCKVTDCEILENADFTRFLSSVPVISSLTDAILTTHVHAQADRRIALAREDARLPNSMTRTFWKFLRRLSFLHK